MRTYNREDADFRAYASGRYGVIHRSELLQMGFDNSKIVRLTRKGELVRKYPQVYILGGAPENWEQKVYAVSRSLGDDWVAGMRTAGRLLRRDGCESNTIEFIGTGRSPGRRTGVLLHETKYLPRKHRTTMRHIPVATAVRVLLDLGAVTSTETVEDATESAIRRGLVSIDYLQRQLDEYRQPGRRGCGVLAEVLNERTPGPATDSRLETMVIRTLRKYRLPLPAKQERIYDDNGFVARTDFFYKFRKLVIEAQSLRYHFGLRAMERDIARRRRLVAMGYRVIEVTNSQLRSDPEGFVRDVARALA